MNDPTPATYWLDARRGESPERCATLLGLVGLVTHVAQRWADALQSADRLAIVLRGNTNLDPAEVREALDQHILNHVAGLRTDGPELRAMVSRRLDGLLAAIDELPSEEVQA